MLHGRTGHISFALSALGHAIVFLAVALPGTGYVRAGGNAVTVLLVEGTGSLPKAQPATTSKRTERHTAQSHEALTSSADAPMVPEKAPEETAASWETAEGRAETAGQGLSPGRFSQISAAIEAELVYPPLARRRRIEGTVVARFLVDTSGHPSEVVLTRSSGYDSLDRATIDAIEKASPYPADVRQVEVPVRFMLGR